MVMMMSQARRMNDGKGWSYDYVKRCLSRKDKRSNKEIEQLHDELIALRTPQPKRHR